MATCLRGQKKYAGPVNHALARYVPARSDVQWAEAGASGNHDTL
jgi:hypothetical protein